MLSLFISLLLTLNKPVIAIEATPSATTNKEVIRELNKQKALKLINSNKPKSVFGTIEKISDKEVIIKWADKSKTLLIDDEAIIVSLKRIKLDLEDLKTGQEILAMGYLNDQNQLETKRIVLIEIKKIENKNQVINGTVVDVSQTSPVFILVPQKNKNTQYQIESTSTQIKKIKTGQKMITVVTPDPEITNTFNLVKIISVSESSTSATPTPKEE